MGVIAIRVSNEIEKQIKEKAQTEGKSISAYCKEVILEGHQEQEQPLSRVTIESQIEKLEKRIDDMSKIIADFAKINFKETHMSSNLVVGFFNAVIDDAEYKQKIYKLAERETEDYMGEVFGQKT